QRHRDLALWKTRGSRASRRARDEAAPLGCASLEHARENAPFAARLAPAPTWAVRRRAWPAGGASSGVPVTTAPALFAPPSALPKCAPASGATVNVEIGAIPILLQPDHPGFCDLLERRFAGFVNPHAKSVCHFHIHLDASGSPSDEDASVFRHGNYWNFQRGDFRAEWNPREGCGWIRQCPNPYSIDTVLRITHSLVLAEQGGFLVHAASAIRRGAAYVFAGISGAGKTTMSRLAPPDATVLTDEISYVRKFSNGYRAYGTPFAGELARSGTNTSAPLQRLYLLVQGPENRVEPVPTLHAARALMRHILFFAHEEELVARVFDSVLEFVSAVEVSRLVFTPDARAWELIG